MIMIDGRVAPRVNHPTVQTATPPVPEQQRQKFQDKVDDALKARADRGGPRRLRATQERVVVVKRDDSFARIAEQNVVSYSKLLAFNRRSDIPNPDRIDPDDVVFVPNTSPEKAAASRRNDKGVPEDEAMFARNLHDRGIAIARANDPSAIQHGKKPKDLAPDIRDIGTDVRHYLQALPADQRQDAALRLIARDWQGAAPAQQAVERAAKAEGLSTDSASVTAQRLHDRGNALKHPDDPSSPDHNPETNGLAGIIRDYLGSLPEGQRHDALQRLYDRDWHDALPAQQAIEHVAGRQRITLADSTHAGPDVEAQARGIINAATGQDPVKALRTLTNGPADAKDAKGKALSSEARAQLRQAVMHNPQIQAMITNAARWANEPLQLRPGSGSRVNPQVPAGAEAADRLDQLTAPYPDPSRKKNEEDKPDMRQVDPLLTVPLVNRATPDWVHFTRDHLQTAGGATMFGPQGMRHIMAVADHIYAANGGQQAVARLVANGPNDPRGAYDALADGIGPAYALEYVHAHAPGTDPGGSMITAGMERYTNDVIKARATDFAKHHEELSWLIENYGPAMTPEQRQAAISNYINSHHGWLQESKDKEAALAKEGAKLVNNWKQVAEFAKSNPTSPIQGLLGQINDMQAQPEVFAAATAAIHDRPELFENGADNGVRILDTLDTLQHASNEARSKNAGRKLVQEAVTAYMKARISGYVNTDLPEEKARANLLRGLRQGVVAKAMGVSDKHYNMAVGALNAAIVERDANVPQEVREQRLRELDKKLNAIGEPGADAEARLRKINNTMEGVKSFSRFTWPGQVMRAWGLKLSGTTALYTGARAINDPTPFTIYKGVIDAAAMGQKLLDFGYGLSGEGTEGLLERAGNTDMTRRFGWLTAVGDLGMSIQYLRRDDPAAAIFSGVMGAGGLTWALGTSAWSGPVGFGLTLAGALALEQHNRIKEMNKFQTQTSADFLHYLGWSPGHDNSNSRLSAEAAHVLTDQSGNGHSPVPILMRYGQLHHLNPQQTVDWINSIVRSEDGSTKLARLRDNLHHTLDHIGGDVNRFGDTADDDAIYLGALRDHQLDSIPSEGTAQSESTMVKGGDSSPHSRVQLDAALGELGIKPPGA